MFFAVMISFVVAGLAPVIMKYVRGLGTWLVLVLPVGLTVYFASFLPQINAGQVLREIRPWLGTLDVHLSFVLDGLSLLFALLICGIGSLIVLYAATYLKEDPALLRFYVILLAFMAAMLGLVLSDNLIVIFVFWELTSLTSYFLIGHKHTYLESRKSALQALIVTGLGGLAMLAGFILLGFMAGSYELSEILPQGLSLQSHPLFLPMIVLVLLGALNKSAQFPFHFWLPNAMAAPTPVSAYLHSATMVKAGIYLIARLTPAFGNTEVWTGFLGTIGLVTLLTSALLALIQTDLKRLLAYSTVAALGTLTMLLGLGSPVATKAAVIFLLGHSLYKAALFMIAGTVDHATNTRDVNQLSGLARAMPITFGSALLAGLSLAGLPPVFGFIGKELAYEALLSERIFLLIAVVANAAMFTVAFLVALKPFWGQASKLEAHEASWGMSLGPALLALLSLGLALFPGILAPFTQSVVTVVLGQTASFKLYLFPPSVTPALILSMVTVALGIGLSLMWPYVQRTLFNLGQRLDWGPAKGYALAMRGLAWLAETQTRLVQSSNLRRQLVALLGFTVLLVGFSVYWRLGLGFIGAVLSNLQFQAAIYKWVLAVLIVIAAFAVLLARSKLLAVTALGVIGFGVALLYVIYAAPDLAITQFLVETLLVIVLVLVMIRLPELHPESRSSNVARWRDALIASLGGLLMCGLLLLVVQLPFDTTLSQYYLDQSVPGGFGRNVVNVILVDFRALDTLGEIVVLAVAALGVLALRRRLKKRVDKEEL